jgi:hypothetical protein
LCENESERISVSSTDLRLAVENVYRIEGMAPNGNKNKVGVLQEIERMSEIDKEISSDISR